MPKDTTLRDAILHDLRTSDAFVEEALLTIYRRQTEDERSAGTTTHHNGVGFNGFDANMGTYCAKWLLDANGNRLPHRHLNGRFLAWARRQMPKYVRQLEDAANMVEAAHETICRSAIEVY